MAEASPVQLPELDVAILVADLARAAVGANFTSTATARIRELLLQHGNQQFNAGRAFEHERLSAARQ